MAVEAAVVRSTASDSEQSLGPQLLAVVEEAAEVPEQQ